MSRRHSQDRTLDVGPRADAPWSHFESAGIPWWYATRMPEPWDYYFWHQWASAWAEITMAVCENVWRKQGARIYATHRDVELREDLRGWLVVKAVESAANFNPDPWHPNPHLQWAKYLYNFLNPAARYHFAEVVGSDSRPGGLAARAAYAAGIDSTEALDEREAEGGRAVSRHPLHGYDHMADDPAAVVIRMEELATQVEQIEREDRRAGRYTFITETCLVNLCTRPTEARGLCTAHYQAERKHAQDRGDWQPRQAAQDCEVDGCDQAHFSRGRCRPHYRELRAQETTCSEEGCDSPVNARGLCGMHYARARQAQAVPCSQEGCPRASKTRGMCGTHYERWRKARDKGEGDAYL